jgi:hypothetical protein
LTLCSVTVKGTLIVERYTSPFFPASAAFRVRTDLDTIAFALPLNVNFQITAPLVVTPGALQDAVMSFGSPDMLMEEPFAPAATTAPPTGVSETVVTTMAAEVTEIADGETVSTAPAAGCTCRVRTLLWLRLSPVAVTVRGNEVAGAVVDANSVNVSLLTLTLAGGACGLTDHFAVTPNGSPLTE